MESVTNFLISHGKLTNLECKTLMSAQKYLSDELIEIECKNGFLHLRNLLTHTLLFWHFLEIEFRIKIILEYNRTIFSGNAWLFSDTTDSEYLK